MTFVIRPGTLYFGTVELHFKLLYSSTFLSIYILYAITYLHIHVNMQPSTFQTLGLRFKSISLIVYDQIGRRPFQFILVLACKHVPQSNPIYLNPCPLNSIFQTFLVTPTSYDYDMISKKGRRVTSWTLLYSVFVMVEFTSRFQPFSIAKKK